MPARRVAVIGAPTSAGSHHAGQDRAPADPAGCAAGALAAVAAAASLVVHFDVDVIDGRDLPLANFPHYGTGYH